MKKEGRGVEKVEFEGVGLCKNEKGCVELNSYLQNQHIYNKMHEPHTNDLKPGLEEEFEVNHFQMRL